MTQNCRLPAWRSLLFCPVNVERFVDKAHTRGADAIILDLEDSIDPASKASARRLVAQAADRVGRSGADVLVRINRQLDSALQDIEFAVGPGVMGLMLPKVIGPDHVRLLDEVVAEREAVMRIEPGRTRFVALVESAAALEQLSAIARASSRMVAMAVGGEDLATDLDADPTADTLYVAKMLGVHAARAAGILPLGVLASVADISDTTKYREMLRRSRSVGLACATCVHPAHVGLINDAFGPSAQDLERASRIVRAYEEGLEQGLGAVFFEGSMIDKPVADRAYRLLARSSSS